MDRDNLDEGGPQSSGTHRYHSPDDHDPLSFALANHLSQPHLPTQYHNNQDASAETPFFYTGDLAGLDARLDPRFDDSGPDALPSHHALDLVDPADFYRDAQRDADDMPAVMASSVPRPTRVNGTTATRTPTRPSNLRSVSSPSGTKPTATTKTVPSKTSVKDLRKRFDPSQASPRTVGRTGGNTPLARTNKDDASRPRNGSYSAIRSSTQDHDEMSPRTNRAKFSAEDQVSNNHQSFASRVAKPRAPASPSSSKAINSLKPQKSSVPVASPPGGLLFGEILPEQRGTHAAGYGIDSVALTPDPSLHDSVADLRIAEDDPSTPSHWYRGDDAYTGGHSRSQSDAALSNSSLPTVRNAPVRASPVAHNGQASSKLPLSVRNQSTTDSSSPSSTRSNSPSTLKRSQAKGPTSRTGTTPTRAKTPSGTKTPRKQPPRGIITSEKDGTLLKAYIAAPPPKTSPPLRSSRPRQPVSIASTASSRLKTVDRGKSPSRLPVRPSVQTKDDTPRRRKISVGPIDFEQRREHIRLAYTKSIRESQALEARQRAAERRRKEMEAAAKAKAEAEAAALAAEAEAAAAASRLDTYNLGESSGTRDESPIISPTQNLPTESIAIAVEAPPSLTVTTEPAPEAHESPTLGLPGSFPAFSPPMPSEEIPISAVSAVTDMTDVTEFDNEPQVDIPATVSPISTTNTPVMNIDPPTPREESVPRAEYQYPFEEESPDLEQRQSPREEPQVEYQYQGLGIPGAFGDDLEEERVSTQPTSDVVTILPPPDDQPSIPFPRLQAGDESDCQSEYSHQQALDTPTDHEDATTDACTEETDHERDDLRRNSRFDDSYAASTCESEAGPDDQSYAYEENFTADTSNSLLAPPARSNRVSHQSAWTDYTVDTSEPSDAAVSPLTQGQESPSFGHATIFSPPQRHDSPPSDRNSGHDPRPSEELSQASNFYGRQYSLDDPNSAPYLSPEDSRYAFVPSPEHEPPPVPPSAAGSGYDSRRASSAYFQESQYGSTALNSGRPSEDFSYAGTPSIDLTSLETPDTQYGAATPADSEAKSMTDAETKQRRRLIQRRNVIKELVDTEAVFVRDMNIVEEIYKGTAEACPKLDDKTVKLIFRNSEEIVEFHTTFLGQIKEAVASVYVPKGGRAPKAREEFINPETNQPSTELTDETDRLTSIGPVFKKNIEKMKLVHEAFLRSSDHAAKRLIQIQQDPTVKVWLNECNEVAKDLTAAWDLDSLLIKPMQRITKYPNLIITLLQHTPQDHPDREKLMVAKDDLETAIIEINKTKKNFELVGQIVGRKRKESDVKAGFARAFGKRVDKLQTSGSRPAEDTVYAKLNEKFGDDYLRLQVVLRDVEFYTRQVSAYVHEFLQYLSSIELVMRLQPGSYPELESKWVQFNISVRDLEKVALEEHLSQVRKHVIEPFELVIKAYGNPSLAMKKRQKRRLDYERYEQLRRSGKSPDVKLKELVEQYEALNDTLKKELPQLSAKTEKIGNICLGNFVNIQANWYRIWKDKMRTVLGDTNDMPDLKEIVSTFQRDYPYAQEQFASLTILNPQYKGRMSQSTTLSADDGLLKTRSRPSDVDTRGRGLSVNDSIPSLPTPDFAKRHSGSFSMSTIGTTGTTGTNALPSPHQYYYKDYYAGIQGSSMGSASPMSTDVAGSSRSAVPSGSTRPSTGRSFDSGGVPRKSSESASQFRRESSAYQSPYLVQDGRRYSGLFQSALPLPDGPEESRQSSSRASSRERASTSNGYNVLWLAASLFEFNIATTKHEAGYPYLVYQAGEIFDVIAEKGELWLAKNQDDPREKVGWIWSKHFAKLADA